MYGPPGPRWARATTSALDVTRARQPDRTRRGDARTRAGQVRPSHRPPPAPRRPARRCRRGASRSPPPPLPPPPAHNTATTSIATTAKGRAPPRRVAAADRRRLPGAGLAGPLEPEPALRLASVSHVAAGRGRRGAADGPTMRPAHRVARRAGRTADGSGRRRGGGGGGPPSTAAPGTRARRPVAVRRRTGSVDLASRVRDRRRASCRWRNGQRSTPPPARGVVRAGCRPLPTRAQSVGVAPERGQAVGQHRPASVGIDGRPPWPPPVGRWSWYRRAITTRCPSGRRRSAWRGRGPPRTLRGARRRRSRGRAG